MENPARTDATTAVFESLASSTLIGSPLDPVSKIRMVSFVPTVMSFLPLGVYARKVGPAGSVYVLVSDTVVRMSYSRAGRTLAPVAMS